jgi:hypothetical protein
VTATARRNAEHVAAGTLDVVTATLAAADLGGRRYDRVFAVNVAHLWREPEVALLRVRALLAPGGRLFACGVGSPGWSDAAAARADGERVAATLRQHGLHVDEVRVREDGVPSFCVVAQP